MLLNVVSEQVASEGNTSKTFRQAYKSWRVKKRARHHDIRNVGSQDAAAPPTNVAGSVEETGPMKGYTLDTATPVKGNPAKSAVASKGVGGGRPTISSSSDDESFGAAADIQAALTANRRQEDALLAQQQAADIGIGVTQHQQTQVAGDNDAVQLRLGRTKSHTGAAPGLDSEPSTDEDISGNGNVVDFWRGVAPGSTGALTTPAALRRQERKAERRKAMQRTNEVDEQGQDGRVRKQQRRHGQASAPGMKMPTVADLVHPRGVLPRAGATNAAKKADRAAAKEAACTWHGKDHGTGAEAAAAGDDDVEEHSDDGVDVDKSSKREQARAEGVALGNSRSVEGDVSAAEGSEGFCSCGLSAALSSHLEECNFDAPTAIQQRAIPAIMTGRDVLVKASTGSGKTLCYLAPVVDMLAATQPRVNRKDGTFALVIAPTRELVLQIQAVLALLLRRFHHLIGGVLLGGENRNHEKQRLRKGVGLLVATPGRLLDHLQHTAAFRTDELRWLVLDEADRLLDMGFRDRLGEIMQLLDQRIAAAGNAHRQTILLSATLDKGLATLAEVALQDPLQIGLEDVLMPQQSIGAAHGGVGTDGSTPFQFSFNGGATVNDSSPGEAAPSEQAEAAGDDEAAHEQYSLPQTLYQHYMEVPCKLRLVALAALLTKYCSTPVAAVHKGSRGGQQRTATPSGSGDHHVKVVVFMSACDCVEFAHKALAGVLTGPGGLPLDPQLLFKLHGLLPQAQRTETFVQFTRASSGILLCTDVAARGLDFPRVTHILQYDPPGPPSEYVHRVGRTARCGASGQAMLLLQPHEGPYLQELSKVGVGNMSCLRLEDVLDSLLPVKYKGRVIKGKSLESHEGAYRLQARVMEAVQQDPALHHLAVDAFKSFVRSYAAHPAPLRHVFHVKGLHLGHVAHAFGLKDRPALVGASNNKAEMKKAKAGKLRPSKRPRMMLQ